MGGISGLGLTLAEVVKLAFLASSAAKDERTEVMICWEWVEAASLSAMAAAVFLESAVVEDGPLESGLDKGTVGSLFSRLLMFAACSSRPWATCYFKQCSSAELNQTFAKF